MKKAILSLFLGLVLFVLQPANAVEIDTGIKILDAVQGFTEKQKIKGKKLENLILNNVITVDYDGKKQSYKFNKDITYEVYEGKKVVGEGTWAIKGLTKSSIKLSGYMDIYFQIYKAKDKISTLANLKKKNDEQTNRKILRIASLNDFEEQLAQVEPKKEKKEVTDKKETKKEEKVTEEKKQVAVETKKEEETQGEQKKTMTALDKLKAKKLKESKEAEERKKIEEEKKLAKLEAQKKEEEKKKQQEQEKSGPELDKLKEKKLTELLEYDKDMEPIIEKARQIHKFLTEVENHSSNGDVIIEAYNKNLLKWADAIDKTNSIEELNKMKLQTYNMQPGLNTVGGYLVKEYIRLETQKNPKLRKIKDKKIAEKKEKEKKLKQEERKRLIEEEVPALLAKSSLPLCKGSPYDSRIVHTLAEDERANTGNEYFDTADQYQNAKNRTLDAYFRTKPEQGYVSFYTTPLYEALQVVSLSELTNWLFSWTDCKGEFIMFDDNRFRRYVGEWKDNVYHGQGTITYFEARSNPFTIYNKASECFSKEWKYGKINGHGICKFKEMMLREGSSEEEQKVKSMYVGEFKNDFPNGQGTHTWPNGLIQKGIFKDGKFIGQQ